MTHFQVPGTHSAHADPTSRRCRHSGPGLIAMAMLIACGPVIGGVAQAAVTVPAPPPPAAAAPPPSPGAASRDDPSTDSRALGEIARRRAVLERRERELDLRESQIAAAEMLARKEISAMNALRNEVEKLITHETNKADADLTLLAGLYSNMKPAQAGAILAKLDVAKAAAILRRLDTRLAGPVLASMDPDVAANITRELERQRSPFRP